MRIGVCAPLREARLVAELGFDFIEPQVAGLMQAYPAETEFDAARRELETSGIYAEAFNVFLPADLKVVGPEVRYHELRGYVQRAFAHVEALGGQVVVFGSGPSRRIPEGFPVDKAMEQLREFLAMAGPLAGRHGIEIAIEALPTCNAIRTVSEAVALARDINHSAVKVLSDFGHVITVGEPLTHVAYAAPDLVHVHLRDRGGGPPGTGDFDYPTYFRLLKQVRYRGRLSMECRWADLATQAGPAISFVRQQWEHA